MTSMEATTNQAHSQSVGISALVTASHETDAGSVETQMRRANAFGELRKDLPWNGGQAESATPALSDNLLEQGHNLWAGSKLSKRVLLSFCARPDAKPVEIDLARYIQVGLAKSPTLFSRKLKTGAYPIHVIGECFHDLQVLNLCDAWLTWRGLHCQAQNGVDSCDSHTPPPYK